MHSTKLLLHIALAVAAVTPAIGWAQTVQAIRLTSPSAEFRTGLTQISGVRELSDGRVIVADAGEKKLRVVNLVTGAATEIGREGEGPGEFGIPRRLFPMRNDTTLLYDSGNDRFMYVTPDGRPGAIVDLSQVQPRNILAVRGADFTGRIYFQTGVIPRRGDTSPGPATETLVRFTRTGSRVDTVAALAIPPGRNTGATTSGLPPGLIRRLNNRPLAEEDAAAVGSDGRVAVVRAKDYRVEWINADGQRVTGAATPFERIRVTDAEKRAFLSDQIVPGGITTFVVGGGATGTSVALPPPTGRPKAGELPPVSGFEDKDLVWPVNKPPFVASGVQIADDGRLWVLRTRAHDDSIPRYDVFDAKAQLVARVELPKKNRVVGFGKSAVYVARTDDVDLQYLRKFTLK